jgi:hypothetical protein
MVALDRIRLTGPLRKIPVFAGIFYLRRQKYALELVGKHFTCRFSQAGDG